MITLTEWRKKQQEMAGTGTIVSKKDCNNPDFQVWGATPCGGPPKTKSEKSFTQKKK